MQMQMPNKRTNANNFTPVLIDGLYVRIPAHQIKRPKYKCKYKPKYKPQLKYKYKSQVQESFYFFTSVLMEGLPVILDKHQILKLIQTIQIQIQIQIQI